MFNQLLKEIQETSVPPKLHKVDVICMWCKKKYGSYNDEAPGISHGLCSTECSIAYLEWAKGES